ncbi:ROK family glucokinase [Oceanobacillus jeddahense]|uniref:Glucokinase n=1 Tax=Oceanobacillus jeddahense TaxID=1462527 RepID=A0ABY5JMI2_9BACI|nr:ROK family glucokinase [Oceanobacillus jeddahense]UUI01336.1 ROK family glucokinase [Oceanobacillus jeddahense]
MNELLVGVDIGGTTVKIGFITEDGNIKEKWEIPTDLTNEGTNIISDVWASIESKLREPLFNNSFIKGIGVGAPGFVDAHAGVIAEAVNIGWKDINLAEELEKLANVPVYVENDANIAVLGENWVGAGNQSRNLIAITLGTGVGGGIIANGSILNGANGMAGEIGHIEVLEDGHLCNCGKRGCLETIASATGIVRQGMEMIQKHPESRLAKLFQSEGSITTQHIFELAKQGDKASKKIIDYTTDVLGKALSNMSMVINPSNILIGGGVSNAGDYLTSAVTKAFRKHALPRVSEVCTIKVCQLGNDAGIIGGAYLVYEKNS